MLSSTTCVWYGVSTIGAIRTSPVSRTRQGELFKTFFSQWKGKSSQMDSDSLHTNNNKKETITIHNKTVSAVSPAVTMPKCVHNSPLNLTNSFSPTSSETIPSLPTLPLQRRVARWFFPGFTHQEKRAGKKTATSQSEEEGTKCSKNKNNGSENKTSVVTNTPTATASQHVVEKEDGQNANVSNNPRKNESTATGQYSGRGVGGVINRTQTVRSLSDHHLPSAFREYVEQRNKHLKAILMNALGNEFAKAGVNNNGLRMSFSAAASEAAKRAIGLRRVPHKLLISCIAGPENVWDWVDITAHPTAALDEYRNALSEVLLDLGAHETLVSDALEPMLLPQATVIRGCHCLVVRYAVDVVSTPMESFQELTNRFTILITDTRVVTIHRTHCAFVENLKRSWSQVTADRGSQGQIHLLSLLVKESVDTFNTALTISS
ncbi:hypothetical protein LSM04_001945 [Trypanosoma melophagium]|uniref:uncharacterized protein n=1 Tax=Trypanosoma melophagium TaxID=715481 RepID=UPI00351A7005|nr:hypothetical protein LSM04_001945 [Trypanosoma melophagium]